MKVPFEDWFDPKNKEHLKAYRHLQKHAAWPSGFIPLGVELSPMWQVLVVNKMAECFLEEKVPAKAPHPVQLSKKAKQKYLKSPDHCPSCESTDYIGLGDLDVVGEGPEAVQSVECGACKLRWQDVYQIKDVILMDD